MHLLHYALEIAVHVKWSIEINSIFRKHTPTTKYIVMQQFVFYSPRPPESVWGRVGQLALQVQSGVGHLKQESIDLLFCFD